MESDSSDSSSDGWIDVDSDGGDALDISDSEDENPGHSKARGQMQNQTEVDALASLNTTVNVSERVSSLATTKVCGYVQYNIYQRVILFVRS